MTIIGGCESVTGNYRSKNQDRAVCFTENQKMHNISVGCICDGIGSLPNSEIAAAMMTDGIGDWYRDISIAISEKNASLEEILGDLSATISELNLSVWEYSRDTGDNIGCTMSLLLIYDDSFYVFHVGDSRIVHFRDMATQITRDEVSMKMSNGKVKGMLANYIGKDKNLWINRYSGELLEGDGFMLGSDGLFSFLDMDKSKVVMDELKKASKAKETAQNFVREALENGSRDNVSCIIIKAIKDKKNFLFKKI